MTADQDGMRPLANYQRCPWCHLPVRPEQSKTTCSACRALHHEVCWKKGGGCTDCGAGRESTL